MIVETNVFKTNNLVSVVIVNYNVGTCLIECINAALPYVHEIIVVDNDSTDSSIDLFSQFYYDEPKLKLIRSKTNRGFAVACNMGAMRAKGDLLFFLNPDCFLDESAVAELTQALVTNNEVGMVGGLLCNRDGSEQGGGRRAIPTPWRSFVRAFGLSKYANRWPKLFFDFHLHMQPLPKQPIEVEAISGACMLVKRTAIEDVGLWDEDYFLHCEDLDWCMRFRQKDWKIMFVPKARVTHNLGMCSKSRPVFVSWHKHKGMIRFYRKFFRHQYPGILLGLVMFGVWLHFSFFVIHNTIKRASRNWHG